MTSLQEVKDKLKGPVFSIITPFKEDESVDCEALAGYVRFLYDQGAKLFYVMGYNSRFSLLSEDEIRKVNEVVAITVRSFNDSACVTIVADPLHCSTATSIKFAEHAKEVGADLISLIFKEKVYFEDQVYNHYKRVSENSPVGILVHQMPLNNGIPGKPPLIRWSSSLTDRVAELPNVVAIKEDTKSDAYTQQMIDILEDRLAIITSGNGMKQWLNFKGRLHGWLSGVGGFCPQAEIQFFNAFNEGDHKKCDQILEDVEFPFNKIKNDYGWHLGIKSALEAAGIMSRFERMPLLQLPDSQHAIVVELMDVILEKASNYTKADNGD